MTIFYEKKNREPFFTGHDTDSASFVFGCPICKTRQEIKFKQMLAAAWGSDEYEDADLRATIAKTFHLPNDNAVYPVKHDCNQCLNSSFLLFDFKETSNSVYSISLRTGAFQENKMHNKSQ